MTAISDIITTADLAYALREHMPTRIKPVHNLDPCVLDLTSIRGICEHVCNNFNDVSFSAEDGVWEVFGEPKDSFLNIITEKDTISGKHKHETLDSFKIVALQHESPISQLVVTEAEIVFDVSKAIIKLNAPQDKIDWFQHFVDDLEKKYLRRVKFRQLLLIERSYGNYASLNLPNAIKTVGAFISFGGIFIDLLIKKINGARYCYIIIYEHPSNPTWENIKGNLWSNLIWLIMIFVAGFIFALLALWVWNRYGININEWITPPSVPTPTLGG